MDWSEFFTADTAPWWWGGVLGLLGAVVGGLVGVLGTKASDNRKFTAEEKRLREQVAATRDDAWRSSLLTVIGEFIGVSEQLRQVYVKVHHAGQGATDHDMNEISSILLLINTKSAEIRMLSRGPVHDAAQMTLDLLRSMVASKDIEKDFGKINELLVKSMARIADVGSVELGYATRPVSGSQKL